MPKTLMCDPRLFDEDLSGRVYVVTGANSGAGLATTEQLVRQGAHVVAACRRVDAGEAATRPLARERGSVEVMELDLARLESVRRFADALTAKHDRIHGLVNNAGVMGTPADAKTADGFELQFGVNHLGHFLLTELLLDTLRESAPSRVVCVSSVAHAGIRKKLATIDLDDLSFERRDYDPIDAYNQSKLAIVIYARRLAERLAGSGVSVFSTHPGWIRSNLVQHSMPPWVQNVLLRPFSGVLGMMSATEGAQTQLHCLLDDDAPSHSGELYSQNSILYPEKKDRPGGWPMRSPNALVYDDALAARLDEVSASLVRLAVPPSAA
jgi:NAD(P)-dependent dehydrogenase (short-subunit alcohol dehydrogenase family)